ncbi:MAG TPA: hypothetical protein VF457_07530 [Burkholderiaceae bacterium]
MWLIALIVVLLLAVVPVMIAARIVGARRTGFGICLAALVVANLIAGVATVMLHGLGLLASPFAAALGYMVILDTSYLRGLLIVFLHYLIVIALAVALSVAFLGSLGAGLHKLERHAPFRLDRPAQSI